METDSTDYEAGNDQNQGVVGTMARNQQHGDSEIEGTQEPGFDPNLVTNKPSGSPEDESLDTTTDGIGEQKYVNDEGID